MVRIILTGLLVNSHKLNFWHVLILILLLNLAAQAIHEMGHWAVYQLYGRGPTWGFIGMVQWWDTPPLHPEEWVATTAPDGAPGWLRLVSAPASSWEQILVSAGGPLASLLAAVVGLFLARCAKNPATRQIGLGLVLVTALVMTLYYLRAPMRTGGDEYGIAAPLGIPKWVIEIPFATAFMLCLALGLRELDTWKTRLIGLGMILLAGIPTGIGLNLLDTLVREQVNQNNPLFQPVLGFSLPVLGMNVLVVLGLWIYWRKLSRSGG
jgi:hypothetical protein